MHLGAHSGRSVGPSVLTTLLVMTAASHCPCRTKVTISMLSLHFQRMSVCTLSTTTRLSFTSCPSASMRWVSGVMCQRAHNSARQRHSKYPPFILLSRHKHHAVQTRLLLGISEWKILPKSSDLVDWTLDSFKKHKFGMLYRSKLQKHTLLFSTPLMPG